MPDRDAELISDALAVPAGALRLISREPLGDGTVAGFDVAHGDGPAAETTIAYVDTSGIAVPAETGLVLDGVARIWTHPADPHLPALAPVAFGGTVSILLERIGIRAVGAPEIIAYRPGRRAVVRVPTGAGRVWLKVVLPRRIERIVDTHRALLEQGIPTPRVRGWAPDGIIVIDDAQGIAATEVAWDPRGLLDEVDRVREHLAAVPLTRAAKTGIPERLAWYERQARIVLSDHAERVARIGRACERGFATDPGPARTIHGDLHIGQLFLAGSDRKPRVSGVIDVDTAGIGDPAEDAAAFLSHAAASALITTAPDGKARMRALVSGAVARWADPRTGALTATHLLGHALGAQLTGDADRAARLLSCAEQAATGRPIDV
ncbi:MAG TPA: aminoglycoside phosphotransferase family protein [Candidatus Microbacterium pullistercoris]|nr:aminoglycoside phosphotransferase family protein [Candidatus Microbacterium pullistercoris]